MQVTAIPCLRDNYAYLLQADRSEEAVVVDPSEAGPVLSAVQQAQLKLVGILNTHHHWDHVGGNEGLIRKLGEMPVWAHASDRGRVPRQSQLLEEDNELDLAGLRFRILHIPGHTLGAVAYITGGAVFTGDTLFAAGCGRLFEGTSEQMYESLNVKLGALPDETRVYCGHEYTAKNLEFARRVEPSNSAVQQKAQRVAEQRRRGEPTVPSTIAEEKQTNPFMRCSSDEVIQNVASRLKGDRRPQAVLGAVRAAKDAF